MLPLVFISLGCCFYLQQTHMIDAFLEYVLIRNGGVYVLEGVKPMIEFELTGTNYSLPYLSRNAPYHLNRSKKMWQFWKDAEKRRSKNPNFSFIERTAFPAQITSHFFINRKAIAEVLSMYQDAFSKVEGFTSPAKLADEFEAENSMFWNVVLQDHYFLGLLFGYGQGNSNYYLQSKSNDQTASIPHIHALIKKNVDLSDLPIPNFRHLESDKRMVEYYCDAKKRILQAYRDKPFITAAKEVFSQS
ncbi:MAG: hypothetical protein H7A39_03930 [Chlamydiales bacterium]|nr:hypothetical protein [Chlamydiales bacterium]